MVDKNNLNQIKAAHKIENYYLCFRNRQVFKVLKNALYSAELYLTKDILRKLAPAESEFFKNDDFNEMKIKFRLGGHAFPPKVYYKVYLDSRVCSTKKMSSQDLICNSKKGCYGALRNMGRYKYLGMTLNDLQLEKLKKYPFPKNMIKSNSSTQIGNYLDDIPARLGGHNNPWKKFDQSILWRNYQINDVFKCINSSNIAGYMNCLTYGSKIDSTIIKAELNDKIINKRKLNSSRNKKLRKQKSEKLFKLYCGKSFDNENESTTNKMKHLEIDVQRIGFQYTYSSIDDDWENDAQILYEWSKELSF